MQEQNPNETQEIEPVDLEEETFDDEPMDDKQLVIINNIQTPTTELPEVDTITLYGDLTEEKASEVVSGLLFLEKNIAHRSKISEEEIAKKIEMYVSTHGGSAAEMFSILDVMESIKIKGCDIKTFGIGKVMSAGVPILAAGTPGERYIGKNCRVMLHSVTSGSVGTIFNMENELKEIKWIQDRYIECLAGYTKMSKSKIKKLFRSQKDIYISSKQAIKLGIADKIL